MKTTVRMITLVTALGLAGALTTAWGAESVVDLISHGETTIAAANSAKAELDAALAQNKALAVEGKQITAQRQQIETAINAYKQKVNDVQTETAKYKKNCQGKQLTADEYKACKAQLAQVNQDIADVNSTSPKLNQQQKAWQARAVKYNQLVQSTPKAVHAADHKYRSAIASEYEWLDKARDRVAQPAFQPYAKKYGCPNVQKPPKTPDAARKMSEGILTCLKKVASMN